MTRPAATLPPEGLEYTSPLGVQGSADLVWTMRLTVLVTVFALCGLFFISLAASAFIKYRKPLRSRKHPPVSSGRL